MAKPQWTTTAGTLATINERESYSKTLIASDPDGDTLTYSKIAGTLPPGITLSTAGVLAGVPLEVDRRKQYQFVTRVTDGTYSVDRTFSLIIQGADAPTWTTTAGSILTVNDGDYVSYQLEATDQDDAIISYKIISGSLPATLSLNEDTGLITGVVDYIHDSTVTYDFTVRVSDGVGYADRTFSITYEANEMPPRTDTSSVTADTSLYTTDHDDITPIYWTYSANSILASVLHQNYIIVDVGVVDPGDKGTYSGQTTLTYSIASGDLPPGMSIDSYNGQIKGSIPLVYSTENTYIFTVQVVKSSPLFVSSTFTRQYKIVVYGQGYNEIEWLPVGKEMVL